MFANLGMAELLVVVGVGFLLFGNRLPKLARSVGEGVRNFKKGLNEEQKAPATPQSNGQVQLRKAKPDPLKELEAAKSTSEKSEQHLRNDGR